MAAQPDLPDPPSGRPRLPPLLPVHARPGADGRWHAPDLARASTLVAASGTIGMKVTVWNTRASPQAPITDTRGNGAALRQLGYHASLRLLPTARTSLTPTTPATTPRSSTAAGAPTTRGRRLHRQAHLQLTSSPATDWTPPTPASSATPPSTNKSPAQPRCRRATPAADALWARLDRELTDLAIWLPTVTPNEIDLISRRVGDYQYNPVWGALIDQLWTR